MPCSFFESVPTQRRGREEQLNTAQNTPATALGINEAQKKFGGKKVAVLQIDHGKCLCTGAIHPEQGERWWVDAGVSETVTLPLFLESNRIGELQYWRHNLEFYQSQVNERLMPFTLAA